MQCGTCAKKNFEALLHRRKRRSRSRPKTKRSSSRKRSVSRKRSGSKRGRSASGRGRQRNFGPRVRVSFNGHSFMAHKKRRDPRRLKSMHPALQKRARATSIVSRQLRQRGLPINVSDSRFQSAVSRVAASL
jgi:hypothetical protein